MTQNIAITSSSKLRKKYVDALKGFLMLSIIAGHLGNYHAIRAIVFVYHVPAFFLISGFFFNIDSGKLKKRMIQLLKPYLSTSVIICVLLFVKNFLKFLLHKESKDILSYALKLISSIIYGSGSRIDFFDVNFISIGAVWFLLALAWCSLFTHLIETMLNHTAAKISAVVILFAVSYISSKYIWLPLSIQSGMCSLLYFYSGFLLKKYNIIEYIYKSNISGKKIIHITAITLASLFSIVAFICSFKNGNMSIVKNKYPNLAVNLIGAFTVPYLLYLFFKCIDKCKNSFIVAVNSYLEFLGKNSLLLLCFHLLELTFVPWSIIMKFMPNTIVYIAVVFVMKVVLLSFALVIAEKL